MHVGGFWMGFGWFLDGLKQILMDFECMFGYFLDGFEMVQDRFRLMDVFDRFWGGLGWISMHFGWISAGFWIDFAGFWMDFGSSCQVLAGFGWIFASSRSTRALPCIFLPVSRMHMCILCPQLYISIISTRLICCPFPHRIQEVSGCFGMDFGLI